MAERLSSIMNKPCDMWFEYYGDNIYTQAYQEPQTVLGISGVGTCESGFPYADTHYGSGW